MTLLVKDLRQARLPPDYEEARDGDEEEEEIPPFGEGDEEQENEADWLETDAEATDDEDEEETDPASKLSQSEPENRAVVANTASGYQLLAVLEAELAELEEAREALLEEKEALLAGHSYPVDLDHPAEDDEKVLAELLKEPLLASMFGRSSSPLGFLSGGGGNNNNSGGNGSATGDVSIPNNLENLVGVGDGSYKGQNGLLTEFIAKHPKLAGWVDRKPKTAFWVSMPVLLLGLFWLLSGITAFFDPPVPVSASGNNGKTTPVVNLTVTPSVPPVPATTMAATAQPATTPVVAPTKTVATTTVTALPSPSPTLAFADSASANSASEAHSGFFAPARLNVAAVSFSYSNDKILKARSQADGLVSPPEKGVLYHFGAYPGEKGNMVLVGDYQTLGAPLVEILQQNDELQVTDRKGNIYTYRVLSYSRLLKTLSTSEGAGAGAGAGATTTPLLTPSPVISSTTPSAGSNSNAGSLSVSGSGVYQTATALASSYASEQPVQVTSFDDFSILQLPGGNGNGSGNASGNGSGIKPASVLTLVSLPKAGAGDPTRLVVRGILTGYRYVPLTPSGTPVVYGTSTPEAEATPGS